MEIANMTKADFDQIMLNHSMYWDSDLTFRLHHPIFVNEFGDTAYVMTDGETIAAYLMGFIAQTGPVAYVHLVAVHPDYRRRGLAQQLYQHFADAARSRNCTQLKATADPTNDLSIQFHLGLGMEMLGEPNGRGIKVVRDYLRPGSDRVVFIKSITS